MENKTNEGKAPKQFCYFCKRGVDEKEGLALPPNVNVSYAKDTDEFSPTRIARSLHEFTTTSASMSCGECAKEKNIAEFLRDASEKFNAYLKFMNQVSQPISERLGTSEKLKYNDIDDCARDVSSIISSAGHAFDYNKGFETILEFLGPEQGKRVFADFLATEFGRINDVGSQSSTNENPIIKTWPLLNHLSNTCFAKECEKINEDYPANENMPDSDIDDYYLGRYLKLMISIPSDIEDRKKILSAYVHQHIDIEHSITISANEGIYIHSLLGNLESMRSLIQLSTNAKVLPNAVECLKYVFNDLIDDEHSKRILKMRFLEFGVDAILEESEEKVIDQFPDIFSRTENVEEIEMQYNDFGTLPESMCELGKLKKLNLSTNMLVRLPENLGHLSQLEELNIEDNLLEYLPESMCNLPKLRVFDASGNKIGALPEKFGEMKEASVIILHENELTELPDSLARMQKLEQLGLSNNKFRAFPEVLCNIASLKSLYLNNQPGSYSDATLNLNSIKYLPKGIENMSSLEVLKLECGSIELNTDVLKLKNLKVLDISFNITTKLT